MATSVETVLVTATLPSPDLPPLHSALGKKQFCWEERVKLLDLWVPGAKSWPRGMQIWAALGMAGYGFCLASYLQTFSKLPAACVSRFPSNDISQQLFLWCRHFTKDNVSLPHPVQALLGKRKGGGGGRLIRGFTSPEGSQLSGLGCLMGKACYLTASK